MSGDNKSDKRRLGRLTGLLLLTVCILFLTAVPARAATTHRLFVATISDGTVKEKVPVYEVRSNSSIRVVPATTKRVLTMFAGARTATVTVTGKTAYYNRRYKTLAWNRSRTLSSKTMVWFRLTGKSGKTYRTYVTLKRPAMPKLQWIRFSDGGEKGTVTRGNPVKVYVNASSTMQTAVCWKIFKNGKEVYKSGWTWGSGSGWTGKYIWEGKPSKGNAAGLSSTAYVPAGVYEIRGYLCYPVGGTAKYYRIAKKLTVVKPESSQKVWNWTVYLSGDDTCDYLAEKVCQSVLEPGMTQIQRAKKLYHWCNRIKYVSGNDFSGRKYVYDISSAAAKARIAAYGKKADQMVAAGKAKVDCGWTYCENMPAIGIKYTKMGLSQLQGDCLLMSLTYKLLCRHAGIKAFVLENSLPAGGKGHHFWNVVQIGSRYYMADINMTTGRTNYDFFLRGRTFTDQYATYKKIASSHAIYQTLYKKVSLTDCPGR